MTKLCFQCFQKDTPKEKEKQVGKLMQCIFFFYFSLPFICGLSLQRLRNSVLFCEINYSLGFQAEFDTHEYAFSSTKGNNLYPIILPWLQTNQRVAAERKDTVISRVIGRNGEMSGTGA